MLKWTLRGLAGLVLIAAMLAAGVLGYRAFRQHQNAQILAIATPRGVAEAGYVRIGGVDQWIQVRGEDRNNPVILMIHGGPCMSSIPFSYQTLRPWERDFTVVEWDQRCAGRTFMRDRAAAAPTMEQIVEDGIAVAEHLRARLHKARIIIVGASWGTRIGTEMVRRRPDLFYAYVGTGQAVNAARGEAVGYARLMERARAEGDAKGVAELTRIGAPPYASPDLLMAERKVLSAHPAAEERGIIGAMLGALWFAPDTSLGDVAGYLSTQNVPEPLLRAMPAYDAVARGTRFEVPMFFFQGEEDIQTPTQLVREYAATISAPKVDLVIFPGGGHFVMGVQSERFRQELIARVRPLAVEAKPPLD